MRKSNTQPIKSVLREYIEALGHRRKLKEVNIVSSWEALMGKVIAAHTKEIFIRNKILYVHLDSSALRNELMFNKERMKTLLNEHVGEIIIEKIVLR